MSCALGGAHSREPRSSVLSPNSISDIADADFEDDDLDGEVTSVGVIGFVSCVGEAKLAGRGSTWRRQINCFVESPFFSLQQMKCVTRSKYLLRGVPVTHEPFQVGDAGLGLLRIRAIAEQRESDGLGRVDAAVVLAQVGVVLAARHRRR